MDTQFLKSLFSLEGKTAIMTGATGGLGSAMALGLAKAGANIVSIEMPNDPNSNALHDLLMPTNRSVTSVTCSLVDSKSLRACWQQLWQEGVQADILVNVAGITRRNKCEDATDEEIDEIMAVNQRAMYISIQEFGRRCFSLNRPGKVVNIASVTSFQPNRNTSVYAMTKGAVVNMTKAFSNEWASRGMNINAIAPGFMKSPMTAPYMKDEEQIKYLLGRVPQQRFGEPEDLVGALLYLASSASDFVNGTTVIVDGGFCGK